MALKPVILVGAGVIGLTTAYTILSRYPGTKLLVLAAELPSDESTTWTADYASMWAGAHYRPIAASTPQELRERKFAIRTAEIMKSVAKKFPQAGVAMLPAHEYIDNPREAELKLKTGDVYAFEGDVFTVLDRQQLPAGARWGCSYATYCVNVTRYCCWLLQEVERMGAQVKRQRVRDIEHAIKLGNELGISQVKTIINCSGTGIFKDPKIVPIRGQTVLVRQQFDKTLTRQCSDGSWSFLIPRPCLGGTIVGGTKQPGDLDTRVSEETRRKLLTSAAEYFPEFVARVDDFEVVRDNVGRRPAREGGMRMELEWLSDGTKIIHGYGAGGRGYEISWAVAEKLVSLLQSRRPLSSSL